MFKYVPVLKFRDQERQVIKKIALSSKIMPLIELLKDTPNTRLTGDFKSIHERELGYLKKPFMLDIPTHYSLQRTETAISNFLSQYQVDYKSRAQKITTLNGIDSLIPVISRNPDIPYRSNSLIDEARLLRRYFTRLAFRTFKTNLLVLMGDIDKVIADKDILIYDINVTDHNEHSLKKDYDLINNIRTRKNCRTVIIRSAIPLPLTNVSLNHGQAVPGIDNSLLKKYSNYKFDAFGDYAGIKNDLPSTGGRISPGLIYYCWKSNSYVGFKGRRNDYSSFRDPIAISVVQSNGWNEYSANHHNNCPGCKKIYQIAKGTQSYGNQATWKGITMLHYLYTMEDNL